MKIPLPLKKLAKSALRIAEILAVILGLPVLAYRIWQPGRNDALKCTQNAIWLGHGWLGDDTWFRRNGRKMEKFRSDAAIETLCRKLAENHIKIVYPHLCPAQVDGRIAAWDDAQLKRFLDVAQEYQIEVLPWVGGVFEGSARIADPLWRKNFLVSIAELLKNHSRLAGIQINVEPLPDGNADFLTLLDEAKAVLKEKKLSVAAYPPPTLWQKSRDVHWEPAYLAQVAKKADQLAVMAYDTAIPWQKFYVRQMTQWTDELVAVIEESHCQLLIGIPAYEDAGVAYHHREVENPAAALSGIAASKKSSKVNGIALYCEWEMTPEKWQTWRRFIQFP